jgi:hypothetical protein
VWLITDKKPNQTLRNKERENFIIAANVQEFEIKEIKLLKDGKEIEEFLTK